MVLTSQSVRRSWSRLRRQELRELQWFRALWRAPQIQQIGWCGTLFLRCLSVRTPGKIFGETKSGPERLYLTTCICVFTSSIGDTMDVWGKTTIIVQDQSIFWVEQDPHLIMHSINCHLHENGTILCFCCWDIQYWLLKDGFDTLEGVCGPLSTN